MNKKETFIKLVEHALSCTEVHPVLKGTLTQEQYDDAISYFEAFKTSIDKKEKAPFTENGKLILATMIEHQEERANMFSAKQIADFAFITARSVSGSVRKLINDGYVEKAGQDPIIYSLTELGKEVKF